MRFGWILWFGTALVQAGEMLPPPAADSPATGPKPFPVNHYDLLQEYSPFVKSMESAKETEKSPDLVVVGYGRIAGESHVIIQAKDNSEKREKIGARFGSKDFPYRLLSVTNASDRKKFMAVLEDRRNRPIKVFYASDSTATAIVSNPSTIAGAPPPATSSNQPMVTRPPINLSGQVTIESLQQGIQNLEANLKRPELLEGTRKGIEKALEAKRQQLQALQNPQNLSTPETAPAPTP